MNINKGTEPARRPVIRQIWTSTRPFRPVLVLLIGIFGVLAATQPSFVTGTNLQNLLTAVSVLWIVSMGMTLVVLTGGVDLRQIPDLGRDHRQAPSP